MYVSATSNVSCNFDDVDICDYRDLSKTGINWSQIRNRSESISYCMYNQARILSNSNSSICSAPHYSYRRHIQSQSITINLFSRLCNNKNECQQNIV